MLSEKTAAFLKENKLAVLMGVILIAIILSVAFLLIGWLPRNIQSSADMGASSSLVPESLYKGSGLGTSYQSNALPPAPSSGSYVEVKEGSMTIDTKNAEGDSSAIRTLAESSGGYIEDMRKYDDDYNLNINLRARVPEAKFQDFVDALKAQYDEKDFTVSFYRISTQNEVNELSIINTAFRNYAELRNRTMTIPLDENQINLLLKITQNELELKRLQEQYTASLSDKQQMSDYATINVALQEKKEVKIMPENLGNQLRLKAKNALEDIANSIMDIATGSVSVFVSAIKYVIYFILFAIPLIFGYKVLVRIYRLLSKRL